MPILARDTFRSAPTFALHDVQARADSILFAAQSQADKVLAQARQRAAAEIEADRRAAVAKGLDEGRRAFDQTARDAAMAKARDRINSLTNALTAAASQFEVEKRRILAAAQSGLVELAYAIAKRVCKAIAVRSSDTAVANAQHLLELVRHEHDIRLHVGPADHAALVDAAKSFVSSFNGSDAASRHFQVIEDQSVAQGGCVLKSRAGTIDATIEAQLDRIAAAILHDTGYSAQPAVATDAPGTPA